MDQNMRMGAQTRAGLSPLGLIWQSNVGSDWQNSGFTHGGAPRPPAQMVSNGMTQAGSVIGSSSMSSTTPSIMASRLASDQPDLFAQDQPQDMMDDLDQDPRRQRRIMLSKQYSQKYRHRQIQYIAQLESEMKTLQAKIAVAIPRVKYTGHQNWFLRSENQSIRQKIGVSSHDLVSKEAENEELKKERDILLGLHEMLMKANMGTSSEPDDHDQIQFMEPAGIQQMDDDMQTDPNSNYGQFECPDNQFAYDNLTEMIHNFNFDSFDFI